MGRTRALTALTLVVLGLGAIEGWRAAAVVGDIRQGQTSMEQGQFVLETTRLNATHEDLQGARGAFQSARGDFASARTILRHDPLMWLAGLVPMLNHQTNTVADLTQMGEDASAIGTAGVDAADAFVSVRSDGSATLPEKSALILDRTRPSFNTIERWLSAVDALRNNVGSGPLLPPLASAIGQFDVRRQRVGQLLQTYDDVQAFAPEFLGFSSPKTYLVLAQNNTELLPTGGLVSVVGVVQIDRGRVTRMEFRDALQFGSDWMRGTGAYDPPPAPLSNYLLKGMSWNLAVSNWSPDFPTAAREAERFYALGGGESVDGVIAINLRTLERLLEITGPVSVPEYNTVVTAGNVFDLTEEYTRGPSAPRTDRKAFVALLAHEVLDRALHPAPGQWSQLIDLIQRLGDEKDLLVYSQDPQQQELISRLGWGGEVGYAGGDFLMLVDASVNGTKLNAVVEESMDLDVRLDAAGAAHTTVGVEYFNNLAPWEAGKAPALIGSLMLGGLYGDYVRAYVPPASTIVDVREDGRPAGVEAVGQELGLTVFGRFFALPRDQRTRLTFDYKTPPVLVADGASYVYRLVLRKQPGQTDRTVTVTLTPPPGLYVTSITVDGKRLGGAAVPLGLVLSTDRVVEYRMEKGSAP